MDKQSIAITTIFLRLVILACLAASFVVLITDSVDDEDFGKLNFKFFYAYKYALAVAAIGSAYMLVQMVIWLITIATRTCFKNRLHIWFHQLFDMIFALVFATAAGAAFWLTFDVQRLTHEGHDDSDNGSNDFDKFFNMVYVAAALLLLAAKITVAVIASTGYVLVRK